METRGCLELRWRHSGLEPEDAGRRLKAAFKLILESAAKRPQGERLRGGVQKAEPQGRTTAMRFARPEEVVYNRPTVLQKRRLPREENSS